MPCALYTPTQVAETVALVEGALAHEFANLLHYADVHRVIERAIAEVTAEEQLQQQQHSSAEEGNGFQVRA